MANPRQSSAHSTQPLCSYHLVPSHAVIQSFFSLFFSTSAHPLFQFPPTPKTTTTRFRYCLLPPSALTQVLRGVLPTGLSDSAYCAPSYVSLKSTLCLWAHKAHCRCEPDHRPLPCQRGHQTTNHRFKPIFSPLIHLQKLLVVARDQMKRSAMMPIARVQLGRLKIIFVSSTRVLSRQKCSVTIRFLLIALNTHTVS